MAATTAQTVLNRVLTRLRNTSLIAATPITDSYQLLLLDFFNQIKQEVEDACDWRALYRTFTVTVTANTNFAVVTGTNERTRVIRAPVSGAGMTQAGYAPSINPADAIIALCFDITSPSTDGQYKMIEMPMNQLLVNLQLANGQTADRPQFFALSASNADNDVAGNAQQVLYVYPTPNNDRTVQITLAVPQTDFTSLLLDANSVGNIFVPTAPIVAGLEWMAREEFGEELGESGAFTEERYREILDNAVGIEEAQKGNSLDLVLL